MSGVANICISLLNTTSPLKLVTCTFLELKFSEITKMKEEKQCLAMPA